MADVPFPDADKIALRDFKPFHIQIARQELDRVSRGDREAWRKRQIFTDNRFGRPLESIQLFGKVEWAVESMSEAILFVWSELQKNALKVKDEGDYLNSLAIFVKDRGSIVASPLQVPEGVEEVHFFPNVPYAMKLERGWSDRAKRGVVKPAFSKARTRFGKSVLLTYDVTVPIGSPKVRRTNTRTAREDGLPVPRIKMRQGKAFR